MNNKNISFLQIVKDIYKEVAIITILPIIAGIGLNTKIKEELTEGYFNNPTYYSNNFFTYEGSDPRFAKKFQRVPVPKFEPDYKDITKKITIFGKPILSLSTQRKIPDPEQSLNEILEGKRKYIWGELSKHDESITTENGTKYLLQNVGHDSIAYRK